MQPYRLLIRHVRISRSVNGYDRGQIRTNISEWRYLSGKFRAIGYSRKPFDGPWLLIWRLQQLRNVGWTKKVDDRSDYRQIFLEMEAEMEKAEKAAKR